MEKLKLDDSKGFATWEVEIENAAGHDEKIKVDAGTGKVVRF